MILSDRWYEHANELLKCNSVGDLHLDWLAEHHAGNRLRNNMYLFDNCYDMLLRRGHISAKHKFGEMPGDCYLWIEQCDHSKVIAYEQQSALWLYIVERRELEGEEIILRVHVRELYYKYLFPDYLKHKLKGCTLQAYRKANFVIGKEGSPKFCKYGDSRDIGYLLTDKDWWTGKPRVTDVVSLTMAAIEYMTFWAHPTENPDEYCGAIIDAPN